MPTIENHAEHPFHLPPQSIPNESGNGKNSPLLDTPVVYQQAVIFPRAGKVDEEGNPVPSLTNVTDAQLARIKAHPVAKGWLKPSGGRLQLVVSDKTSADSTPDADATGLGGNNKATPKK